MVNGTALAPRPPTPEQLRQEYVAGGIPGWYGENRAVSLTAAADELQAAFGLDLYERMLLDPQIAADVTVLWAAIIEDGFTFGAAVTDANDPQYALATAIRDEAAAMYDTLPTDNLLYDQLSALWNGYSVAEIVYDTRRGTAGRSLLNVTAIKVKPPQNVAFVVDAYQNVLGLLALLPGQGRLLGAGMPLDQVTVSSLLPREKFCILTHHPRYGDPRGTSLLQPVFGPWNDKVQLAPEYRKYLSQFAGPSLIGTAPPGAQDALLVDQNGVPLRDENGNPIRVTAQKAMYDALLNFRNGTVTVLPDGAAVQPVNMQGDGSAFLAAFARADLQITKAILTQVLTTEEAQFQTRAATTVHQDVQDTLVRQGKRFVQRAHYWDVLVPWVKLNWGEPYLHLTPHPSLGTVEQHDMTPTMNAIANMRRAGYFYSQAQLQQIDRMLNIAERDLATPGDLGGGPAPQPAPVGVAA
jgi:Protein of unknown function (DUF935)